MNYSIRLQVSSTALKEELAASPAKQELLIRTLDVSRSASTEEKRRAIATSIAEGFESDIAAARENDVLRVISDLDLAHVLALVVLSRPRPPSDMSALLGEVHFVVHDLGQIDARLLGLEDRLMAVLVGQGLATNEMIPTYNRSLSSFRITPFGRLVLDRFSDENG